MTRIDFYITQANGAGDRRLLACRLAEKAYQLGHRIYLHTESQPEATLMDDLLWTFKQNSFIPHALYPGADAQMTPILIGHDTEPDMAGDVLINLAHEVPPFFSRFERVAEIVDQDESRRENARARFRFYRDRGYELDSHTISG